jgi:negative regulator of sigma E activity
LRDALSALADGEVVEPDLVAEALLDPDATTLIVTLAETRYTLRDTSSEPSGAFSERVEQALTLERRSRFLVVKRMAPAVCAGLGLTAGLLVGVWLSPLATGRAPVVSAPVPAAVVTVAPLPAPAPSTGLLAQPAGGAPVPVVRKNLPPRTRSVYRFEPGRNWQEGGLAP